MKCFYCLMLLLCLQLRANAQEIKGLTIGETIPDLGITKMMNTAATSSNLSSYKGKLLILDFMATSCSGCIKALPRLDSLKHKFSDMVEILLVTAERQERITAFLKRHPGFQLPFVAQDTTLANLFPHQFLSHIAWIDQTGKVRAITASEYITDQNIQTMLRGEAVHWPEKRDFTSFDFDEPILTVNENNIPQSDLPLKTLYTAIFNYLPGVQKHIGQKRDSIYEITRYSYINYSIPQLYLLLYQCYNLPKSHILLDVKNRERFIYDPANGTMEDWKLKNLYCLETVMSNNLDSAAQKEKLLTDLDFYFACKGRLEQRLTGCLILQNKQSGIKVNTNAGKGIRVGMLVYLLNDSIGGVPVINETTGTTYTTLPLTVELIRDDAYLRKMLDQNGLELVKGQRMINCLVITQPSSAN